MHYFEHERLDVYAVALDFAEFADVIAAHLPRRRAYLADQLRRASASVLLNVAEGAGEYAGPEKARFYRMARRSATECAAILDLARRLAIAPGSEIEQARAPLWRVVSMLTVLAQRGRGEGERVESAGDR